jgi:hypothetical protein
LLLWAGADGWEVSQVICEYIVVRDEAVREKRVCEAEVEGRRPGYRAVRWMFIFSIRESLVTSRFRDERKPEVLRPFYSFSYALS